MHFSIPDTQELKDETGSSYTVFNLHVNGVLHCVARYSQLHDLNEQLRQEFGADNLPVFPPKRLLALKGVDLELRKFNLEKYIQEVCQNPRLSGSETFATFLSRAQQETQREESVAAKFEVFLMNGSKISVDIQTTDKTDLILESAISMLGVDEDLTHYFGLFLIKEKSKGQYSMIRKLQEFECPYISLKCLKEPQLYKVVVRKSYWDQSFDNVVAQDQIGLNLLNVQAESDVAINWTCCSKEAKQRLSNLKSKGSKHEHLQLCQTLINYGYIQFDPCMTDYPKKNSKVIIGVGNYELKFKVLTGENEVKQEKFSITRIKSWKISSTSGENLKSNDHPLLQLSLEYLVGKNNLRWISVLSNQAIMISMCIKSMVDELIRKRKGEKIKKPSDRATSGSRPSFKPRDKTTEALFRGTDIEIGDAETTGSMQKAKESVKKLSDKISSLSKSGSANNLADASDNTDALQVSMTTKTTFEEIGDEDL